METRLDVECRCTLCPLYFVIIDLGSLIGKETGSGFHLSGLKCPNCSSKLDFDVQRVKDYKGRKKEETKYHKSLKNA